MRAGLKGFMFGSTCFIDVSRKFQSMEIDPLLRILASQNGSDLYMSTGAPPCARFEGVLKPLGNEAFKVGDIAKIGRAHV